MRKITALVILFCLCLPTLQADNAETIKQNMIKRLPRIQELKKDGMIGENQQGYLEAVQSSIPAADKAVIEDENADRKTVYEAIAKQKGTTIELVGKLRAKKIFEAGQNRRILETEDGSWSKKYIKRELPIYRRKLTPPRHAKIFVSVRVFRGLKECCRCQHYIASSTIQSAICPSSELKFAADKEDFFSLIAYTCEDNLYS